MAKTNCKAEQAMVRSQVRSDEFEGDRADLWMCNFDIGNGFFG